MEIYVNNSMDCDSNTNGRVWRVRAVPGRNIGKFQRFGDTSIYLKWIKNREDHMVCIGELDHMCGCVGV